MNTEEAIKGMESFQIVEDFCYWKKYEELWSSDWITSCGIVFIFSRSFMKGYIYCPWCGRKIKWIEGYDKNE